MFNFASRTAQLNRIITFDLLGIPQDYLFRRAAWGPGGGGKMRVLACTPQQVHSRPCPCFSDRGAMCVLALNAKQSATHVRQPPLETACPCAAGV